MLTQNRVQDALPRLPRTYNDCGVQVRRLTVRAYSWLSISIRPIIGATPLYLSNLHDVFSVKGHSRARVKVVVELCAGVSKAAASTPCALAGHDQGCGRTINAVRCSRACRAHTCRYRRESGNQPSGSWHEAYQHLTWRPGKTLHTRAIRDIVAIR